MKGIETWQLMWNGYDKEGLNRSIVQFGVYELVATPNKKERLLLFTNKKGEKEKEKLTYSFKTTKDPTAFATVKRGKRGAGNE